MSQRWKYYNKHWTEEFKRLLMKRAKQKLLIHLALLIRALKTGVPAVMHGSGSVMIW